MKALKVLSAVALVALMSACGTKELVLDYTNLKMNHGDTQTVAVMNSTNPCTWTTGDVNVATIKQDNGLKNDVTAVHVGETAVTITDSKGAKATLVVTVESKYNLFKQPDLSLIGKTRADVIAVFGEPLVDQDNENGVAIGYADENGVYTFFGFEDGVVAYIQVAMGVNSQEALDNFFNFLEEYYYLIRTTQSGKIYADATELEKATYVATAMYSSGAARATYFKYEAEAGAPQNVPALKLF